MKDEPALCREVGAHAAPRGRVGVKRGRVALDLVTRPTSRGILVTFLAPVRIEQRPEALLRSEDAVEHGATAVELRPLRGRQAANWIPGLQTPTRRGDANGHPPHPPTRHGAECTPPSLRPP